MKQNGAKPTWSYLTRFLCVTACHYDRIWQYNTDYITWSDFHHSLCVCRKFLSQFAALKSIGQLVNVILRTVTRPIHRRLHTVHCDEGSCDFVESGNLCINVVCCMLTWIIVSATSACLEPERNLISIIYSVFVTYSTVGFGDIIPFENHKYVFMISVLPGLSFMSSSIDSAVAYMEKSNMASTRCFDLANCLSTKREARITGRWRSASHTEQ
ncbi:hypothetical protein OS493_039590 [Desmophyllum pertusum]|uniref:Potassium channel domain-containing protein n=1 Tax=Desmophyllum pertusum TaxID=174260 RepID=A0A9W9YX60_9CNID|nr:hypothetical protein OS493_039590 [Desmophyllum pertusum]